jgi:rare lipoprotein A
MIRLWLVSLCLLLVACGAATPAPVEPKQGAGQHGYASWYGNQFHGRRTANGERFDQNALTAAHRTLPFGTKVRVWNKKNGRSVVVRINDRGPFGKKRRIIDVSRGAARKLDMIKAGVVPVRLEVLWTP